MAYVLGFFAADGYITVNKRGGQFWSIQIIDRGLLEKIKIAVDSEHKITTKNSKKKDGKSFRLQIGSIEMCDDLRSLGYGERKTKNLVVPNIPNKYFSEFVRGYFDGDGNVWVGLVHKDRKKPTLIIYTAFTSCSKVFLDALKIKLESFDVYGGTIRQGKGNYYRLVYSVTNSLKLCGFMYNGVSVVGNNLYLQRKKKVFDSFIKMRS